MLEECCFVDGVRIDHTESEVDALFHFIAEKNLCGFVELNIHEGGLALSIMQEFPKLNYLGVERDEFIVSDAAKLTAKTKKCHQIIYGDSISAEIITQVSKWMDNIWPVLIYCDGNKLAQIDKYKNLIRFGDFLGTHDYWNKARIIYELPDYPNETLKPEVLDSDLKYMRHLFQPTRFAPLVNTRILILCRRTK